MRERVSPGTTAHIQKLILRKSSCSITHTRASTESSASHTPAHSITCTSTLTESSIHMQQTQAHTCMGPCSVHQVRYSHTTLSRSPPMLPSPHHALLPRHASILCVTLLCAHAPVCPRFCVSTLLCVHASTWTVLDHHRVCQARTLGKTLNTSWENSGPSRVPSKVPSQDLSELRQHLLGTLAGEHRDDPC